MVVLRLTKVSTPQRRRLTREPILQHVQPTPQALSADGVPSAGHADPRRAARSGLHLLGAVRGHAVLPAWPGPFPAGDLRGAAQLRGQAQPPRHQCPEPLDLGLRQRAPPLAAVPGGLPRAAGPLSAPARGRRKFRFKNKLVSLDSTVIDLCASLFDWAKFRQTKGAVKLHLLLDHDGYLPSVVVITEGRRHDVRVARQLRFDPGTILILDRGY